MGDTESSEAGIWRRGLEGDAKAFGEIFDLHKDRVFRHAFRLLLDRHDAEDVTGTVFLELWRKRTRVRVVDGSLLPWLLVTAGHAAANTRRATSRYRALLDRIPRTEHLPAVEDEVLARLAPLGEDLHRLLQQLGPIDRSLATLVIVEGYPIGEAAELLKLTPAAAKTRLSRMKARLRLTIAPALSGQGDIS
ncbi:sigma-70 family RNA polymerase sigma factor [Herbiconiux sp. CPCC 203407]|uniref:Sigma-70 family RNA polymerase sigma factor n=1 Tax=Herbiconiux oxytropis TaxID=2970915 RepID=A0AA41XEZ4_9MICO|nr:sigma-70 family RNA polymerase sigma factor [Herbiconiux oxytropis]MCS5724080.1 sigma-70 family RNA polymerase sigma factor [Herbiconiux oxytropis]MCS5726987.1 sigma-70 family RNA polymerase sigma factor [Herbiconiux oxytropis]